MSTLIARTKRKARIKALKARATVNKILIGKAEKMMKAGNSVNVPASLMIGVQMKNYRQQFDSAQASLYTFNNPINQRKRRKLARQMNRKVA